MYKTDNQKEHTVEHRGLYPGVYSDLNWKEFYKGGDYMYMYS